MAKREKIIVIVAVVFLVVGGIYYLLPYLTSSKKEKTVDAAKIKTELNTFVTGVTVTMAKETVESNESYIMDRNPELICQFG